MRKISGLCGVSVVAVLMIASATHATFTAPSSLIFSASFDGGSADADLSLNGGNTAIRGVEYYNEAASFDYSHSATGGYANSGGLSVGAAEYGSGRARWETPTAINADAGMVEMWFKTSDCSNAQTWLFRFAGDVGLFYSKGTNELIFSTSSGSIKAGMSGRNIADDQWHHVAVSWSNDTSNASVKGRRIWLDGQNIAWDNTNTSAFTGIDYIGVGQIWGNSTSGVTYDELHVYNAAEAFYGPNGWTEIGYQGQMVPEPMTIGLLAAGCVGLLRRRVA
jgi:hypothetical protein